MVAQAQPTNRSEVSMLKQLILLALAVLLPVSVLAAPPAALTGNLTLEDCIQQGLTYNPQVHAYALAIDESDQAVLEAWGAFLPTLSLGYNVNDLSNNSDTERDTDYLDQNSQSLNVRLTQPLFTSFSGVAGVKRARQSREYRRAELDFMRQQLVREVSTSFYSHLQASQRAAQWQASVERLQRQKEIAAAWVAQELAPRLRLLETEVELSNARHELIRAQSQQQIAAAQLRQWLALDARAPLNLQGEFAPEQSLSPCGQLGDCLQLALQQRPDLQLAQLSIEMARQDAHAVLARNLPQAQIEGGWTDYQREYDDPLYPEDDREYYSVSLNLSMKPFQGGRNLAAWRKQRIAVDRYSHQLAATRHQITSDVETRYQQLQEAGARIHTAQTALNEARAAYQVAERSAELGIVSLDDLLNAELRLTRAEINLIDSRAEAALARVQLDYAIGTPVR